MYSYHRLLILYLLAILHHVLAAAAPANDKLPPSFSVEMLGAAHQSKSFGGVQRDGGGGGLVDGKHLIVFSDTSTIRDDELIGFTSNSVAYSSGKYPTKLTDFGENGVPYLGVPWLANETALSEKLKKAGDDDRLVIWPTSSIAALSRGKTGVSVYELVRISPDKKDTILYSTMVQYKPTSKGPGATRLAPTLFYPGEVHYGTFSTTSSIDEDYILLFATVNKGKGINLARAPTSHPADRSKYTYWNGKTWSRHPPSPTSTKAHVVSDARLIACGDFLYSAHLQTWLIIYFDASLDSTFYLRYSTSGDAQGPYSKPIVVLRTVPKKGDFNYGGHAYAGYDKTGQSVVLSWTYRGAQTGMARVKFH